MLKWGTRSPPVSCRTWSGIPSCRYRRDATGRVRSCQHGIAGRSPQRHERKHFQHPAKVLSSAYESIFSSWWKHFRKSVAPATREHILTSSEKYYLLARWSISSLKKEYIFSGKCRTLPSTRNPLPSYWAHILRRCPILHLYYYIPG